MLALRNILPLTGVGLIAGIGAYFLFRPKRQDPNELERERRTYLNRVGRIVEGQIVEIVDEATALSRKSFANTSVAIPLSSGVSTSTAMSTAERAPFGAGATVAVSEKPARRPDILSKRPIELLADGSQKLLYYTYSISGVTYETAQDITGMEERVHLNRVAAGQTASVKYDPANPSNSILLADDWSGLH